MMKISLAVTASLAFLSGCALPLRAQDKAPVAVVLDFQLDVGDADLYIVQPDERKPLYVVATNTSAAPLQGELRATIKSYDGSSFDVAQKAAIAAGQTARLEIPRDRLGSLGVKWVTARLVGADQKPLGQEELAFALMEPAGPTPATEREMPFAISYGAGEDNVSPVAAQAMARAGVSQWRALINSGAEKPDWNNVLKGVRVHQQHGVAPYVMLTGRQGWMKSASGKPGRSQAPVIEDWRKWVRLVGEQFRGQKVYWEIWNEPDIGFFNGTTDQYLEMLRVAHQELEKIDPQNFVVMTGGFASLAHGDAKKGMVERVLTESRDAFELVAYHEHGPFDKYRRGLDEQMQPLLDKMERPARLFLTETGMDTRNGQEFQARELVKKMVYAWARGVHTYTWFNLHDMKQAKHPKQPGFTYGLYTQLLPKPGTGEWAYEDSYPKASYVALNTLSTLTRGHKYQKQLELPGDRHAYVFGKGDDQLIVSWNQGWSGSSSVYLVPTDARKVERVDLMGNRQSVPVIEGQALLEINATPTFLVLEGATKPLQLGEALAAPLETAAPDGAAVELRNPFTQPLQVNYRWNAPNTLKVGSEAQQTVTLAPGERKRIETTVELTGRRPVSLGENLTNRLDYAMPALNLKGTVEVPYRVNAVTVARGDYPKANSFLLDELNQVTNLFEADPNTDHLLWKSWQDKSVAAFLAQQGGDLKMRLQVTDDVHHAVADDVARGDSVLVWFSVPGKTGVWSFAVAEVGGRAVVKTLSAPDGMAAAQPVASVQSEGSRRVFEVRFPLAALGLGEGARFNVVAVDHDNRPQGVEGYISAAPGGVPGQVDASQWPRLLMAK